MRAALTIVLPSTSPAGQRVLRLGLYLGLLFTAIAILLLALAPFGWRVGWWGDRFSLLTLMPYAACAGLAAAIVSALLLLFARRAIGARGGAIVLATLLAGALVAYVPWHYRTLARNVPPIDDITTDTNNPPAYIALVPLRKAEHSNPSAYAGAKTAGLQGFCGGAGYSERDGLDHRRDRPRCRPDRGRPAELLDGIYRRHRAAGDCFRVRESR